MFGNVMSYFTPFANNDIFVDAMRIERGNKICRVNARLDYSLIMLNTFRHFILFDNASKIKYSWNKNHFCLTSYKTLSAR